MDIGISNTLVTNQSHAPASPVLPFAAQRPEVSDREVQPTLDVASAKREQSNEPIEQAVSSIQSFVQSIQRDLNFSLDDSSGRVVVKVTDTTSGEVIRQLPSEEALRLAESLEEVRSLLFKAEA